MIFQNKNSTPTSNSSAISTHVFAPDNSGFICTKKEQFTHFKGTGSRDKFGLLFEEVEKKLTSFITKYNQPGCSERLSNILSTLKKDVSDVKRGPTPSPAQLANFVINTGHIPILLSKISNAAAYSIAARSIAPAEVSSFFGQLPGALEQAVAYMAKQRLMQLIATFRESLCAERRQQEKINKNALLILNRMIIELDEQVICENQKSLPEYEQFDLSETFYDKIASLACALDSKHETLITKIFNSLNEIPTKHSNTVAAQRELSKEIYLCLKTYIENHIGLPLGDVDNDEDSQEMSEEQDAQLTEILPLLVYLNASTNPFACNGLVGKIASDAFYREALGAYIEHERRETFPDQKIGCYQYRYQPSSIRYTYTEEQIDSLLFGINAPRENGIGIFAGLLASEPSRHGQLQLPTAPQHLAITAGPSVIVTGAPTHNVFQ
jgi:hypothetical protein